MIYKIGRHISLMTNLDLSLEQYVEPLMHNIVMIPSQINSKIASNFIDKIGGEWVANYKAIKIKFVSKVLCHYEVTETITKDAMTEIVLQHFIPDHFCVFQYLTLHANALLIRGNKSIALLGNSGTGKSTLSYYFYCKHHNIISDDVLILDNNLNCMWNHNAVKLDSISCENYGIHFSNLTKKETINFPSSDVDVCCDKMFYLNPNEISPKLNGCKISKMDSINKIKILYTSIYNILNYSAEMKRNASRKLLDLQSKIQLYEVSYNKSYSVLEKIYDAILLK